MIENGCSLHTVHRLGIQITIQKLGIQFTIHRLKMHENLQVHRCAFTALKRKCRQDVKGGKYASSFKKYAFHHHHSLRYHPKHMHSTIIHFLICYRNSKYPVMRLAQWNRQKHWNSTKRIKQIEEEKMNKQSGSNRAASARPQQCILPEFSPLVLGGAPQPQPPPC